MMCRMKPYNLLLAGLSLVAHSVQAQTSLYHADFTDNAGNIVNRTVYVPSSTDQAIWAVAGAPGVDLINSSNALAWHDAEETCSWISQEVNVNGYTSLTLDVQINEIGSFVGSDSVAVYVIEDGVQRLVASEAGSDFGSLTLSESCTADMSLQVLVLVRSDLGYLTLNDVEITGTASFTDIDGDGIDDASDVCIDMDGDGTCDPSDASITLMNEDFGSYSIGTGLGTLTNDEAGIAHVEGTTGPGQSGWALLGEVQRTGVTVRTADSKQFLSYSYTGSNSSDTSGVTYLSRRFDLAHITDPEVRIVLSEVTADFTEANSMGQFSVALIEDGVERHVFSVHGEFTAVDSTIHVLAEEELYVVVRGYAQREASLRLDELKVTGGFCQSGKDSNGECQDIGCTDPRACSYNSLAIVHDVTKCKYIGDACDDGDATNFSDRYTNAGDGTCGCEGVDLQSVYFEDFGPGGEAQGGLGYGYEGSFDVSTYPNNTNGSALETEWALTFEGSGIGDGSSIFPSPGYFATQLVSADTIMKAQNTNGQYMRWTTRTIDVSDFDSVYVSADLLGLGFQSAADYAHIGWMDDGVLQSPLLEEITGVSSATRSVLEKVTASSGNLQVQVEIENNTGVFNTAASHGFDDVHVTGLKRGCTDPDASNYDATPADGFLARSDDGTCEYDWDKAYSRKDGAFDDVIWAGKPCSEAGYTCNASTMYIDIHGVTESGTRHAVVSANTQVTVPTGGYSLGELTLEAGATLVLPEGEILTVNGAFHHQGGSISGTGRLIVKGEMEIVDGVTSVDVHDFTFETGASLNLQHGDTLRVKGDLTINDGSAMSGRIELAGSEHQTVSGTDIRFDTLRVNSTAVTGGLPAVTFAGNAKITGVLDIDKGLVDMDGHVVTFASDANGTGMLDLMTTGEGALIDGHSGTSEAASAVSKRYIAADDDGVTFWGYTLYSSPLQGATVGDFASASDFYYAGVEGSDYPDAYSTVLFWDEKSASIVEPHSASTPLDTLGGAWVTLLGNQTPTLHSEGKLRNHLSGMAVAMGLTRTPSSSYDGWNLVYNPYQAMLDWHEVIDYTGNGDVLEDQYAVFDTQSKGFARYSKTNTELTSASRYIMPGQGFWVRMNHATDTTATLNVPASAISVEENGAAFIRSEEEDLFDAVLVLEVENGFGSDKASVRFGDVGSTEYNRTFDLSYMGSSSINKGQLAVMAGGWPCVSKALPREASADLWVKSIPNWPTTLRVVDFTSGADVCITVTDTETGEIIISRVGDEMTFTLPQHEAAPGRFVLEVVPSAEVFARPPSCPALEDGRVEVTVGQEPTNVLLTDGGDNVLDQVLGATGSAVFQDLLPGDYGLVVAGPDMRCGTERRSFTVEPGVEPELLGLDWTVPACNDGEVQLSFELYGHGDFDANLRLGNDLVWSSMEDGGDVLVTGMAPGTYTLGVDHVCLEETVVLDLYDAATVVAEADYSPMVVMDPVGGTALEAFSACVGEESYRWVVDGEMVGENEPLFYPVFNSGGHVVELEAWNATCSDIVELPFLVLNWNEARVLDAPVSVREEWDHWVLSFGQDLGRTELILRDAAGREVWSGMTQADAGVAQRIARPDVAGTYVLQITSVEGQWGLPLLTAGF